MKRIKLIYLLILGLILVGCSSGPSIEIFRFASHENTVQVGESVNLDLIMGEYPEDSEIEYEISADDIITFEDGVATGLQVGKVTVKATVDSVKYATTIVEVTREPMDGMRIIAPGDTNTITLNESLFLQVQVYPDKFANDVTWKIEIGEDIAQITSGGLLRIFPGTNINGRRIRVVATSLVDPEMAAKRDFFVED